MRGVVRSRAKREQPTALDGGRARENGEWAETKLSFLDYYAPVAIDATERKVRRVYVDLFAGPGVNVPATGGPEFESGALRVLQAHGVRYPGLTFSDAVLVNIDPLDCAALEARVDRLVASGECLIPRHRIQVICRDSNLAIADILSRFNQRDYILVFADCEAPRQWPWSSVEKLRESGHTSIDLYTLFPLEMGIRRQLSYDAEQIPKMAPAFDPFFGSSRWQEIVARRVTESQGSTCSRELVELYLGRLRNLWEYADQVVDVHLRGDQGLYRMLFAADAEAAKRIATWVKKRLANRDQLTLF